MAYESIEEVDARLETLRSEVETFAAADSLTEEQAERFAAIPAELDALDSERAEHVSRAATIERIRKMVPTERNSAPGCDPGLQVIVRDDPIDVLNDRAASPAQLADAVTRSIEDRIVNGDNLGHARSLFKRHQRDTNWARNMLARSTDIYTEAFAKGITGREALMSNEERAALAVGTNTAGGFLVPTHLDPSIVLTNDGSSNAIRAISRVVTLTDGNAWNGVTSAGSSVSWDAELAEVSDDTPAVARVSVPVYKGQGFIQASIEAFEDIASLTSDVAMVLGDAKDRLEGAAHATGSGSAQPTGIFTALDANTNVELVSTTAATIGLVDLQAAYRAVPVRWRGGSTWVMNPLYLLAIQALGTAISASYSTDITAPLTNRILGKSVVESDDAPTTQTTTVRDNEIVFGDFSNYLIVDKPGSTSVEFIPHLFNTSNNLPDGRRGWYLYFRSGADSVNDLAFRLLQDKTSA